MPKEVDCPIVTGAKKLAARQGLPVELVVCPRICDKQEPCVPSMVEVFNARIDAEARLLDVRRTAGFHANGDTI